MMGVARGVGELSSPHSILSTSSQNPKFPSKHKRFEMQILKCFSEKREYDEDKLFIKRLIFKKGEEKWCLVVHNCTRSVKMYVRI